MTQDFPIAPASGVFRALTGLILSLAALLLLVGVFGGMPVLEWAAAGVAFAAAVVWVVYRPTRFSVGPRGIDIFWPARRMSIPRSQIREVRILERSSDMKDLFGVAFRIGVGGLFGTFGLLWTKNRGPVTVYITRTHNLVLVERHDRRPLLLSPVDPEGFVEVLQQSNGDLGSPG